jgi:hypothetical protein
MDDSNTLTRTVRDMGTGSFKLGYNLISNRFDMISVALEVEAAWRYWSCVFLDFLLDTFPLLLLGLFFEHCG